MCPITEEFILTDYVSQALAQAVYDKLDEGTFAGRISACPRVIAFAKTLSKCEDELRSTLEDWILVDSNLAIRNRRWEMVQKVNEMTIEQLQALIDERVQEQLKDIFGDPDEGLEVREEIIEKLKAQRKHRKKRIPGEEVMRQYGLEPK